MENVRLGAAQSHAQGIEGQFLAQGTAQSKTSYRSAVSVQDHGQVDEAPPQANVGDVRYPDLIRLPKFHSPNQVGIALVAVSAVGSFDLYSANSMAAPQLPQVAAHHAHEAAAYLLVAVEQQPGDSQTRVGSSGLVRQAQTPCSRLVQHPCSSTCCADTRTTRTVSPHSPDLPERLSQPVSPPGCFQKAAPLF